MKEKRNKKLNQQKQKRKKKKKKEKTNRQRQKERMKEKKIFQKGKKNLYRQETYSTEKREGEKDASDQLNFRLQRESKSIPATWLELTLSGEFSTDENELVTTFPYSLKITSLLSQFRETFSTLLASDVSTPSLTFPLFNLFYT